MKKTLIAAILISLPAAAFAVKEVTVSRRMPIGSAGMVQIVAERGEFEIVSGTDGEFSYQVEFVSNQGSGWWGADELTKEQMDGAKASFDPLTGVLKIAADKTLSAKVRVTLPAKTPLKVRFGAGILNVASRTGYLDAEIGTGIITYDASGLGRNICVDALVKVGVVDNDRDVDCESTGATLRSKTGTITVN